MTGTVVKIGSRRAALRACSPADFNLDHLAIRGDVRASRIDVIPGPFNRMQHQYASPSAKRYGRVV